MQVTRTQGRCSRLVLLAGILAVSALLVPAGTAAAQSSAGKQTQQIMDPFGLQMVLVRPVAVTSGPGNSVRPERPAGVSIPSRPQPRSPFTPPPSWRPGPPPWLQK